VTYDAWRLLCWQERLANNSTDVFSGGMVAAKSADEDFAAEFLAEAKEKEAALDEILAKVTSPLCMYQALRPDMVQARADCVVAHTGEGAAGAVGPIPAAAAEAGGIAESDRRQSRKVQGLRRTGTQQPGGAD